MQAVSRRTETPDAYEAGLELAEGVEAIEPEILFLFASAHYTLTELLEGLTTVLTPCPVIIGGTGYGVYETEGIGERGISVLALNSGGTVEWRAAGTEKAEMEELYRRVRESSGTKGEEPDLYFVLAGFRRDGTLITEALRRLTDRPFFGGLTGDSWLFERSWVLTQEGVYPDGLALLAVREKQPGALPFLLNTGSGWTPRGRSGRVEESQANAVSRIDGQSAYGFLADRLGRPPSEAELGVLPLAAYQDGRYFLRTPYEINIETGRLRCFGALPQGTHVRLCTAGEEDILQGVNRTVDQVQPLPFEPKAALVVSCGGRRWALGDQASQEIRRVFQALERTIPLAGFSTFGEIGPFFENGSYSPVFFHNVSFVLCLIG